jgi:hypothetical protein
VKPFCAVLDHALTFSGELPEIGGEDGWADYRARHLEWDSKLTHLSG